MISGRDTLGHLTSSLQTGRNELARLEASLQSASTAVAENRQRQADSLKRLAAIRLDHISSSQIEKSLDAAGFRARELLHERDQAMQALRGQIADEESGLEELESQREAMHSKVDAAAVLLAQTESEVQSRLQQDAAFQAQLEEAQRVEAIAVSAAEKAQLAQTDSTAKAKPYQADRLFMYLWDRGYGTSDYDANTLSRFLDGWVARLCNFENHRSNYWMLLEIPKRLMEHADSVRDTADDELDQLRELEAAAAQQGGVAEARTALAETEARQDDVDAKISAAESHLHTLRAEQGRFAAGEDDYIAQCLTMLAEAMQHQELSELMRMSRATMTVEDDALVDEVRRLRDHDDELRVELEQYRELHAEHLRRLAELEQVRQKFKQHRYDDLRSGFSNSEMILLLMQQVLNGGVRGGTLWDAIRRYQRYQDVGGAWPDFGSGGIVLGGPRRSRRRPTWHWPGNSGSGRRGGFRLPPGRSSGGSGGRRGGGRGGFRTGGGF